MNTETLLNNTEAEIERLKGQLKAADALILLLANRIAAYPPSRRINKDEWALDAFEDYKYKHL